MLRLSEREWTRIFKEVLVFALRRTHPRASDQQWSARERAQEAVQRACERYLTLRPPEVDDADALRAYLIAAVRGLLSHERRDAAARRHHEGMAAIEQRTLGGGVGPPMGSGLASVVEPDAYIAPAASAEALHVDQARRQADHTRAVRRLDRLRKALEASGDTLALGTIDCLARGIESAQDQAAQLGCSVVDVYNARRRRGRALEQVVAEDARADHEEEDP